ncbi:OLC1v1029447C1 [Oldenlandia corymbosa var. corymbosa]|uniref:OLC1v1029447C1 n=1 Tax=Oldenlandia corymbosa var. corymbosa TaxID=529605 RepID=A0AAV1CEJ8_OLDCO|nr:OLC1v1029447C1 [Oldenlandia corymbosa var. corymbosa]
MKRLGTCFHCLAFFSSLCLLKFVVISSLTEKEILLQFKGNISSDPFNTLSSWDPSGSPCRDFSGVFCNSAGNVEKIVLWNTNLGGILAPSLAGLKSLRTLNLFGNKFTGNIPSQYVEIDTLWKINVSSNALSGSIPEFLGELPSIRFLDLSKNGYTGEIPPALFDNCFKTRFISFSGNNLSGPIPPEIGNCLSLEGLDLSYNSVSGNLPPEICSGIPGLLYLSLRSNLLSGTVQEKVSACRQLEFLDLGTNLFTGLAPFGLLGGPNFQYLNISHNGFEEGFPEIETCSDTFQFLDVSGNNFFGRIPPSITKCSGLKYIDLSSNRLTGSLPHEIANLKQLLVIRLADNSIDGTIPAEFGSIEWLQALDLHNMNITGEIPDEIANCRFLRELDVSGNSLEGEIPQNLYNMSYLLILDLHKNLLNGSIPLTLGNLSNLHSLDLSENHLSGQIPDTLGNLKNLTHFNVSYNDLSGPVPSAQIIQGFGASAFSHNPGLCGAPLETSCPGNVTTAARKPKLSVSAIVAIVAAALILTGVCIISVMNLRARSRRREEEAVMVESTPLASTDSNFIIGKLVLFSKTLPSKYEDWEAGTKALLDKECIIGGGSIGTVYKTTFEGDVSIAVKKLETLGGIRNQDEFEHEIGRLGNLQHPNLVALQGYYWSSSMQLILTEFIPNGNLTLIERGAASDCLDRSLRGYAENELIQVMKLGLICTSEVPSRRPSMAEVVQVLESIRNGIGS